MIPVWGESQQEHKQKRKLRKALLSGASDPVVDTGHAQKGTAVSVRCQPKRRRVPEGQEENDTWGKMKLVRKCKKEATGYRSW